MRTRLPLFLLALMPTLIIPALITPVEGQATAPDPAAAQAPGQGDRALPPNLASDLAAARPVGSGVALAVGAAKVPLPKDAVLPGVTPSVTETANLYGWVTRPCGGVTAVVPPRITVVYSPPETPNPYADMPPAQALKMLAATFTPAQWKAFLSPAGVGAADLTGETQHALFQALFPDGHLELIRDNATDPNDSKSKQDITGGALAQAHLRLGYIVSLALPNVGKPDVHTFAAGYDAPDAPPRYFMMNAHTDNVDREYGALVREEVSNTPKRGDLSWDLPALQAAVPLERVRTADDLVAHAAAATRLEIYADPRYGSRALTLVGLARSARAADLLSALALCVGGTFRRVGTAYVLTDDLVGMGVRHAQWKAFEEKAKAMLPGSDSPQGAGGQVASAPYTQQDIPWGDDPIAFTSAQQKEYWAKEQVTPSFGGGILDLTLPFDKLSSAQQEAARAVLQEDQKMKLDVTLDGSIIVQAEPELEIVLPGLDGPVVVTQSYENLLPKPGSTPLPGLLPGAAPARPVPPRPAPPAAPEGSLREALRTFSHRAARIAPRTAAEMRVDLTALKTLGFNEAWVPVPLGPDAKSDAAAVALIAQAVKEGRAGGVTVCPEIRLLDWGRDTPPALLDRDLRGLTPSAARDADGVQRTPEDGPDTVSPFDPAVADRLAALVRDLGAVPDIGGMVWEDFTPPGYTPLSPDGFDDSYGDQLGYAEAGRVVSLRRGHTDPLDVYTNHYTDVRAHVSVPGFGDDYKMERVLYDGWRRLRADAAHGLMLRLASALPPSFRLGTVPHRAILVPPVNLPFTSAFGTWDDLRAPPPAEEFVTAKGPDGMPTPGGAVIERMPSARVYHLLTAWRPPGQPVSTAARSLAAGLRRLSHGQGDAVIVDASGTPGLLEELAASKG